METLAPLAAALPEPPAEGPYTEDNWRTLLAIMDTVIPSIRRETTATDKSTQLTISDIEYNKTVNYFKNNTNAPDSKSLDEYFDERPSANPKFQELLKRTFVFNVREDARKGLGFILAALNTRVGCLMLTGSATLFCQQPPHIREQILQRWRISYLPPLNDIYAQMTRICKSLYLKTSPAFHKVSGFPVVPDHYKPGPHFEYEFMQFPAGSEPEIIETDVVIVGSGCGGGVAAKNLAESGHKVVVVDKAYYYPPSQLPMTEEAGGIHLFENGGADNSDDSSTTIVAGSSWGGGGTINWSASLQTQNYVRKEWAQDRGLTFFETAEFQNCLDRVCHRMGVSCDHIRHNFANRALLEGSRKLGYHAKAVPQNTGGAEHYCGHCAVGCGAAQKQGPVVAWLPDAAKAGAKFVEGFEIHNVIFDESSGTKKAVGVKGTWTSRNSKGGVDGPLSGKTVREVIVRAKKVVISSGTLWSPIILLNSGLTNHQIGKNLYLHPVNFVIGVYKDDVKPWEGGILTTVCSSFENLDGHGHGVKLECTAMLPSYILTLANWNSGLDYKTLALKYRHMTGFISIGRDRDTGRVYPDSVSGKPRYQYTPSAFDRAHIMEGIVAIAKMCYVTGATEIHPCIAGVPAFVRDSEDISTSTSEGDPGITDPCFKTWLEDLKRTGNKPPTAPFACAHQMGSNRMSVRAQDGVVDPKGRVWGTEDLYVADASVFPSASGVNPMVTNMAISDWISRGISRELRGVGEGGSRL
ncbi:putative long-chain-alcohol oxidase FAO2 [Acephala macrosclerotiorum]|nr:putative long-chain-alcohol oxidase FAO2 [Acephala macrosclerotiorum]